MVSRLKAITHYSSNIKTRNSEHSLYEVTGEAFSKYFKLFSFLAKAAKSLLGIAKDAPLNDETKYYLERQYTLTSQINDTFQIPKLFTDLSHLSQACGEWRKSCADQAFCSVKAVFSSAATLVGTAITVSSLFDKLKLIDPWKVTKDMTGRLVNAGDLISLGLSNMAVMDSIGASGDKSGKKKGVSSGGVALIQDLGPKSLKLILGSAKVATLFFGPLTHSGVLTGIAHVKLALPLIQLIDKGCVFGKELSTLGGTTKALRDLVSKGLNLILDSAKVSTLFYGAFVNPAVPAAVSIASLFLLLIKFVEESGDVFGKEESPSKVARPSPLPA